MSICICGRTAVRPYLSFLLASRCGGLACRCCVWTHSSASLPVLLVSVTLWWVGVLLLCVDAQQCVLTCPSCERHAVVGWRVAVVCGRTAVRPYLSFLLASRCGGLARCCCVWTHSSASLLVPLVGVTLWWFGVSLLCVDAQQCVLTVAFDEGFAWRMKASLAPRPSPLDPIPRFPPAISPAVFALLLQTPWAACSALLSRIRLRSC